MSPKHFCQDTTFKLNQETLPSSPEALDAAIPDCHTWRAWQGRKQRPIQEPATQLALVEVTKCFNQIRLDGDGMPGRCKVVQITAEDTSEDALGQVSFVLMGGEGHEVYAPGHKAARNSRWTVMAPNRR